MARIYSIITRAIAARAAAANPANVLELAAGTGIVTRHLRDRLPADVGLTATDLNAPMLNIARAKFGAHEPVSFGHADAHKLPYDDDSFDLIACQFGVMFFHNRIAAYKEAARVVRPGGRILFSTWGTQAENPFSEIAHDALAAFFDHEPPEHMPPLAASLILRMPIKFWVKSISTFFHNLPEMAWF